MESNCSPPFSFTPEWPITFNKQTLLHDLSSLESNPQTHQQTSSQAPFPLTKHMAHTGRLSSPECFKSISTPIAFLFLDCLFLIPYQQIWFIFQRVPQHPLSSAICPNLSPHPESRSSHLFCCVLFRPVPGRALNVLYVWQLIVFWLSLHLENEELEGKCGITHISTPQCKSQSLTTVHA